MILNFSYILNKKIVKTAFRSVTLFIILSFSVSQLKADVIEVGGIVATDQHWTSGNTYIVTQDLIVTNNLNLIIDAGVIVKVEFGRGITIENANIEVNGELNDTVYFSPNYTFPGSTWYWKGIEIKNITQDNDVRIEYASIYKAEIAIGIENSTGINIRNSYIFNSRNYGIQLMGTSSSKVKNCRITNSSVGIEISAAVFERSANNIISNCILSNKNFNIYILREAGGVIKNNVVTKNIISSGSAGVWIVNNGLSTSSVNTISENVIFNNREEPGYGIYIDYDSTQILNNIIWDNNIALDFHGKGKYSMVSKNSFYKNRRTIVIGQGSESNIFKNNTLSENTSEYIKIWETQNVICSDNNILHYGDLQNIVINFTDSDLDISDNYWGTNSEEKIKDLIYDNDDSPLYGKLNYLPLKPMIDTASPVSPVFNVKKQKVDNNLKISWNSNQESDLKSYRLYFGEFKDYSFSSYMDNISDTVIILPQNFDIEDDIAITAIDSMASSIYQLDGHESPFAFAVAYPYAGTDTTICNDINAFDIVSSSVPFEYDQLFWEANGDGNFNNINLIAPQYYFGNNDFENGEVILTINVLSDNKIYKDSLKINILKYPIAFAGNDTIILRDDDYYCINSYAENYDSINWVSLGDGVFDTISSVNPIYTPGINDNENAEVSLLMNAYSRCGVETDTVKIIIEPYYSMQGRLFDYMQQPYPGNVVAMRIESDQTARAYQMQSVSTDGNFEFAKLRGGKYYLYAVPDTNNYENAVPTYYPNKLKWNNAHSINLYLNTYDLDVIVQSFDFELPIGEASISGHVNSTIEKNYNPEIYCEPWFGDNMQTFCSEGSSNITVFLYNSDRSKLLDYTLSDWQGNFYFNELPYGNYVLTAEKAAYNCFPSEVINLNPENKIKDDLLLEFSNQNITFKSVNETEFGDDLIIYPNPVVDKINIISNEEIIQIILFDRNGKIILKNVPQNQSMAVIDSQSYDSGVYFLNVKTLSSNYMKKVIIL